MDRSIKRFMVVAFTKFRFGRGFLLTIGGLTSQLDTGVYSSSIIFTSADAVDSPDTLVAILRVITAAGDTITLGTAQCQTEAAFELPVTLRSGAPISSLQIPLIFDTGWFSVDSVRRTAAVPANMTLVCSRDSVLAVSILILSGTSADTLPSGDNHIATIFGTAKSREA